MLVLYCDPPAFAVEIVLVLLALNNELFVFESSALIGPVWQRSASGQRDPDNQGCTVVHCEVSYTVLCGIHHISQSPVTRQ